MPTLKEIKLALGNMDKSSNEPSREVININENTNPFSEKLFAPVEDLQYEIKDKDKIIANLKEDVAELKNQIYIIEKEKSIISEELRKSKWLENKVTLATKKVYEDKVRSVINKNLDSKLINILTTTARRKQGKQRLNWGNWLKIPENGYLFKVNGTIAKKIFEDTNALIPKKRTRGSGGTKHVKGPYILTFAGDGGPNDYVSTTFNPDNYDGTGTGLNHGFTVSYWIKPNEIGGFLKALGRR